MTVKEFARKNGYSLKRLIKNFNDQGISVDKNSQMESEYESSISILKRRKTLLHYVENVILFAIVSEVFFYWFFGQYLTYIYFVLLYSVYVSIFGLIYGFRQSWFSFTVSVSVLTYLIFEQYGSFVSIVAYPEFFIYFTIIAFFAVITSLVNYLFTSRANLLNRVLELEKEKVRRLRIKNEEISTDLVQLKMEVLNTEQIYTKVFQFIEDLNSPTIHELYDRAIDSIYMALGAEEVSIYFLNGLFGRLVAKTKNSNPDATINLAYAQEMIEEFHINGMFINTKMSKMYPQAAYPIFVEDNLVGIINVNGVMASRFSAANKYYIKAVIKLLHEFLVIAMRDEEIPREGFMPDSTRVLQEERFQKVVSVFASKRFHYGIESLLVRVLNYNYIDLENLIKNNIRITDYIGVIDGEVYILFTLIDLKGKDYLRGRFNDTGISVEEVSLDDYVD